MAPLCAEFGISRKTGYKIFDRYKDCGLEALTADSRCVRMADRNAPIRIPSHLTMTGQIACRPRNASESGGTSFRRDRTFRVRDDQRGEGLLTDSIRRRAP